MKNKTFYLLILICAVTLSACHLFLPDGTPPQAGITDPVPLTPKKLPLDAAMQEMQKRVAMYWAFKQPQQPPKVRLLNNMTNLDFQRIGYRFFTQLSRDDVIAPLASSNAFVMEQAFAFAVNEYDNNQSVLSWEILIYPPQPYGDDRDIAQPTAYSIRKKPVWRSLPIHVNWEDVTKINDVKLPEWKAKRDSSFVIRPLKYE